MLTTNDVIMQQQIISRKEALAKGLKHYFTGKPCKHGHICERSIHGHCIICRDQRVREIRLANPEKSTLASKKYYFKNRDKALKYHTEYYKSHRNKKIKFASNYRDENKEKVKRAKNNYRVNNKEKVNKAFIEWSKANPMQSFARHSLRRIEKAAGIDRIKKSERELGYTQKDFMKHIESQFKDGMTWDNRREWHIDHIKPLSVFIKEGVTDPKIINALSNLQPLGAKENREKSNKWI